MTTLRIIATARRTRLVASAGAAGITASDAAQPDMGCTWAPGREPGGAYAVAVTSIGLLPNEAGAAVQIMLAPFGSGRRPRPRKARA